MALEQSVLLHLDNFLEAASVAQKWRTLADLERRLQVRLSRAFRRQRALALASAPGWAVAAVACAWRRAGPVQRRPPCDCAPASSFR